jgi:hypothetical protein
VQIIAYLNSAVFGRDSEHLFGIEFGLAITSG